MSGMIGGSVTAAPSIISLTLNDGSDDVHDPSANGIRELAFSDPDGAFDFSFEYQQTGLHPNNTPVTWTLRWKTNTSNTAWMNRSGSSAGLKGEIIMEVEEYSVA